jgi:integrase
MATKRRRKHATILSNGRGTLVIERRFPLPVGKIRRASGTTDPQAFKGVNDMLTAMAESVPPRYDILRAIKEKKIAPMYALSLWRQGELESVASALLLPPLQTSMQTWMEQLEVSKGYKSQIKSTLNALLRQETEPTVGDLPLLLQRYREECRVKEIPSQFNHAKKHAQSFIRDTLRKRHELYAEVTDVPSLAEAGDTLRRPQKPVALMAILQLLQQPHRRMAWELAVTGMRPAEYFDKWEVRDLPPHIHIFGTKTAAAERNVPLWTGELLGPQRSRDAFEDTFRRRIGALLAVYDLRRSFAVWMEDAGISRSRQMLYMGHSVGGVTGLYQTRELQQWMKEDAGRLWAYAGDVVEMELGAPNAFLAA